MLYFVSSYRNFYNIKYPLCNAGNGHVSKIYFFFKLLRCSTDFLTNCFEMSNVRECKFPQDTFDGQCLKIILMNILDLVKLF